MHSDDEQNDSSQLRPLGNDAASSKYVSTLLQRLQELAELSAPEKGEASAVDKDLRAFQALRCAARLTEAVAGWAINHQIGLAQQGLEFLPLGSRRLLESEQYKIAKAAVDRHDHELNGRNAKALPAFVARQALINVLRPSMGLPDVLLEPVMHALEALDHGDLRPIFEPATTGARYSLRARQLLLRAICFVAYRVHAGIATKGQAELEVVEAYGYSGEKTFDGWVKQVNIHFDPLVVTRTVQYAENFGSSVKKHKRAVRLGEVGDPALALHADEQYGEAAVAAAAAEFRSLTSKG